MTPNWKPPRELHPALRLWREFCQAEKDAERTRIGVALASLFKKKEH